MNWLLVKNSFLVGGGATLLATVFGFIAALFLAGLPRRNRNLVLTFWIIALALPPFLATNCWLDLLGAAGKWRGWLPFNIMSLSGTIWIIALLLWPMTSLVVSSAWGRLEPAQLEADPLVRGWMLIRVLLIPVGRGALAQAAVITFVLALNNFAVPAILQVKVLPAEMWIRFATAFDSVGVLRMSWPLVLAPLLLVVWLTRREFWWPHLATPVSARLFRQQLGSGWFYATAACTFALCMVSVVLPLWQLAAARRTWTELRGAIAAGQYAIWNSFWFAAASAALLIGASLYFVTMTRCGERARPWAQPLSTSTEARGTEAGDHHGLLGPRTGALRAMLWLPFLVPGVLIGIALIWMFNRPFTVLLYQSAAIVVLAFAIRYLGFAANAVAHALKTVDRGLVDVARLEGATRWQTLRYAQWPQIKAQMAAAWYIVFLLCLWDVESMILVYPPGGETLALRIFNLLHYGHNAQVNALCLTLLGVAALPLLAWCIGKLVVRLVWPSSA